MISIILFIYFVIGILLTTGAMSLANKEFPIKLPIRVWVLMGIFWPCYLICGWIMPYITGMKNEDYLNHRTKKNGTNKNNNPKS